MPRFKHDQRDRAFYSRSEDAVHLPRQDASEAQRTITERLCMNWPTGAATLPA